MHRGSPELDGLDTIKFAEPLYRVRDALDPAQIRRAILLILAGGGVHMVSEAAGHQAPEVYTVPRGAVAVAALGASAVIAAGLAGIFAASSVLKRQPR